MSTMLPFTTTDLLFAVVAVGALLLLSVVVYAIARFQQPAGRHLTLVPVEAETAVTAVTAAPSPSASPSAVQHA